MRIFGINCLLGRFDPTIFRDHEFSIVLPSSKLRFLYFHSLLQPVSLEHTTYLPHNYLDNYSAFLTIEKVQPYAALILFQFAPSQFENKGCYFVPIIESKYCWLLHSYSY